MSIYDTVPETEWQWEKKKSNLLKVIKKKKSKAIMP